MTDQLDRLKDALSDRYSVERELGRGGMATVYLAHDLKHDRQVAIKVLRPDLAAALGPERFHREIKIAAQLQHPNILPLHDSGEADGLLYYVMPYVEGQSLRDKLAREGELPIGDAVRLLRDVVDALTEAHAHGVVHRDIKPENILLRGRHALVTDFGVAKAVSEAADREQLTTAGVALGTPAYMAPEQASADPHLDQRVDIYAVGAVAYELLTGRAVFVETTQQAVLAAHMTRAPEPLTKHRETVPAALEQLVLRCLEKKPADRWQTAEDLLSQLEALATPSGGVTPTDMRPIGTVQRRRKVVLTVLGAAAGVIVVAAVAILLGSRSRPELDPNLVGVAPFDVLTADQDLAVWREGMVDLLSRSLDGAGPLRTLSPTVAIRRWEGRADAATAAQFGRNTGAGLTVFGTIVGVGSDSVRVVATLLGVAREVPLAEIELRDRADRLDRLADSLAVRLLGDLSRTRPVSATPMYSIGSALPAAIKAFLRGEQHYRRSDWDSAKVYYEQAIRLDSSFALAHRRMGIVLGWDALEFGRGSEAAARHRLLASALSAGLAPRESLLVMADSLFASMTDFAGDSAAWTLIDRLFSTLEYAAGRYPEDPEVWNELGEARFHFGQSVGATIEETRLAFARAIELDSGYAPAYPHSLTLTLMLDGPEAARDIAERYLAVAPSGYESDAARLFAALLDEDRTQSASVQQMLDTLSADALFGAGRFLVRYPDSAEATVRVARARMRRDSTILDLRSTLAFRGHFADAYEVIESGDWRAPSLTNWRTQEFFAEMAEFGAFPADTVDAIFNEWLDTGWGPGASNGIRWWAARRDTIALGRFVRLAEQMIQSPQVAVADTGFIRWVTKMGSAHLTLALGDTTTALQQLEVIPQWPTTFYVHTLRLTRAQLLTATGRDTEAAEILDQMSQLESAPGPLDVIWVLERARVNERLGNHDKAIRDYAYVMDVWRGADALLQPFVDEARAAVGRLAGEPRG